MLSCLRNVLIAVGSYWLSTLAIVPVGILFNKITNHVTFGDSIAAAILTGVMLSMGRAVAAAAAGICVTLVAEGNNSEFWATIPTVLYATRLFRYHFAVAPTAWDRVEVYVQKFFPALACIVAAFLVARLRRVRGERS